MSETPRNPDDATPDPAEGTIPTPDHGSSAFDEPTNRIPVSGPAGENYPAGEKYPVGESYPASDNNPTVAFPVAKPRVLSTETDFPVGENQTQRIPTYDELSAPRRAPEEVAASMDQILASDVPAKRGTLDTGLLLIRLALGAILFAHGLQKLTGWWGGPNVSGFESYLNSLGFEYAQGLSYVGPITEVVAGVMLVLGLLTPVAGAAAVAVLINAWAAVQSSAAGFQFFASQGGSPGVEFETMLLVTAAGLCLTGAGKLSLDANRGWTHRPLWGSLTFLVLGIAAGGATWAVLNGSNPFA